MEKGHKMKNKPLFNSIKELKSFLDKNKHLDLKCLLNCGSFNIEGNLERYCIYICRWHNGAKKLKLMKILM